jgi:F-type H+-transporting ATPase subunit delta
MSNDVSIAGRYARALLILSEKQTAKSGQALIGVLEQTLDELQGLAELFGQGSRAGAYLLNPQVSPADRRRVLDGALQGKVLPSVRVFADLLLRKHRLNVISAVAHEFQVIVERKKGLERAVVVSAVPLPEAERLRLVKELERVTGKKIVLETRVDATLLGGAYVRIGDRVIDRSVKTLLSTIANQLYEVSV